MQISSYDDLHWSKPHAALHNQPGMRSVRRLRMRWLGHRLVADAELDIDPRLSLAEAHHIAHDAEHTLTHALPKLNEVTVHAYPAHPVAAVSS